MNYDRPKAVCFGVGCRLRKIPYPVAGYIDRKENVLS
jgi:hypothetical protein